jgi:hypothetical protein
MNWNGLAKKGCDKMKIKTFHLIVALLIIAAAVIFGGCSGQDNGSQTQSVSTTEKHSNVILPIEQRSFYLGLVPTPVNAPDSTFDDVVRAYEETGGIAEIQMVWVEPAGIGQYEKLKQNRVITALRVYGLKPVVTLQFATIKEVPGDGLQYVVDAPSGINADLSDPEFRTLWVEEATNIAREFNPEYLSLGNEINDYFYLHPEDLEDYISLYDEAYAEIKKVSPETKVFMVFSYTHIVDNNQFDMLERFNDRVDLIGLTTYPWKYFDTPADIPDDYYSRLDQHIDKPIAFIEIGWISSDSKGSSEAEQADYLVRFLELTDGMDIEMVNWLFLHETVLEGTVASVSEPETGTISLKNKDGSKKPIYNIWLDVRDLKIVR